MPPVSMSSLWMADVFRLGGHFQHSLKECCSSLFHQGIYMQQCSRLDSINSACTCEYSCIARAEPALLEKGNVHYEKHGTPEISDLLGSKVLAMKVVSSSQRTTSSASVGIETFQFRDTRGTSEIVTATSNHTNATPNAPSAYSRLYAQGVDLLEHKDHVFRQFGLHKSTHDESAPSCVARDSTKTAPRAATAVLQRTAISHNVLQSPRARPSQHQGQTKQLQGKHRSTSSQTPYASSSERHSKSSGTTMAPTFSFQSTMESRQLISPKSKLSSKRRNLSASGNNSLRGTFQSSSNSHGKLSHASASRQSSNTNSRPTACYANTRNRTEGTTTSTKRPLHSFAPATLNSIPRASGACGRTPRAGSSHHQDASHNCAARIAKRSSFQVPNGQQSNQHTAASSRPGGGGGSSRDPTVSQTPPSKRPSMRTNGGTTCADPNVPVLVQVSRRTSSPIVSNSVAEFGMRKRPSVSPIPALLSVDDCQQQQQHPPPQPRAPMLVRRDSKMDRLVEQLTVLKATLGLSDEDLQWKVESTKGNAYLAAEKHLNEGEERYDRLVYEMQLLSETPCEEVSTHLVKQVRELMQQAQVIADTKPALALCQNDATRLKKELMDARIAAELQRATSSGNGKGSKLDAREPSSPPPPFAVNALSSVTQQLEQAQERILQLQEQLKVDMTRLNDMLLALSSDTDKLAKTCAAFRFLSPEATDASATLLALLKRIPECAATGEKKLVSLCDQALQTAQRLRGSRLRDLKNKEVDLSKTLQDIDIWKARRDQAKEFPFELAKREQQWRRDQFDENANSLKLLRSMVPQDIQQLNVEAIIERAHSVGGVLYTYDLAIYIKQNRFLHWLVTHESDIARDNFLAIECASWFMNFVAYDIHELRACSAILPSAFDFDKDGKKGDWKTQFMEHVYALVKQQQGEKVKCGWDPVRRQRGEVQLQPLTDKQLVNAVYRYPSEQEIQMRIDKFELQKKRLDQKQEKYRHLEDDAIPAAKAEYLAIAEDARSEELQKSFGKATLIRMRDDAKQAFQRMCKTRDALKSEIAHSEKQWHAMSPTYTQYLDEVDKIRKLAPQVRNARIPGPFPGVMELKPRERAAFKKLSVEEEAQARKMELENAIASRGKEISDAVAMEQSAAPVPTTLDAAPAPLWESSPPVASAEAVPASEDSNAANPQPRGSFRRVKSLQVSAEVLKFLQQDFCSPHRINKQAGGGAGGTALHRTASMSKAANNAGGALGDTAAAIVKIKRFASDRSVFNARGNGGKEDNAGSDSSVAASRSDLKPAATPVRPKSKALLQLLADAAANGTSSEKSAPGRPRSPMKPMDMFSELQNRFLKKKKKDDDSNEDTATATSQSDGDLPAPPPKMMSFLDELKQKSLRKSGNTSESQSEQVDRSHQTKQATAPFSATANPTTTPLPPPAPSASSASPKSFLEELRAKAKSTP